MQLELIIASIAILIFSVIVHELAHGYAALMLGDPTAKMAGRLTLNPASHLDPMGSVILPALLALMPSPFIIGWAKPVPYNPYNLKHGRWGEAIVAGAGPAVNLIIALIFGLALRFAIDVGVASEAFVTVTSIVVFINILLGIFNLIPLPSFDGAKVLRSVLPFKYAQSLANFEARMARYGMFSLLIFAFLFFILLWPVFLRLIMFLFSLITGMTFF